MRKNAVSGWVYNGITPKLDYSDPRIIIAKHIGWQKYAGSDTIYSIPEPDNYNRAVFTEKPVECKLVEDQVVYKERVKNGWMCVLLVSDAEEQAYNTWLEQLKPLAHWFHNHPARIRNKKSTAL